jgi:hypothetical protein
LDVLTKAINKNLLSFVGEKQIFLARPGDEEEAKIDRKRKESSTSIFFFKETIEERHYRCKSEAISLLRDPQIPVFACYFSLFPSRKSGKVLLSVSVLN